jgi:putative hydrolase of the HAD superfamily
MPRNRIQAVLFDMGGTLEELYYDEDLRREATGGLRDLLREHGIDPGLSLPDLQAAVSSGLRAYQAWRKESEAELSPAIVWGEYILAGCGLSPEKLSETAEEITLFYETHFHKRSLRPEAPAALEALHAGGYRLAIISNVISRRLVPQKLAEYGIAHYFDPVVTSSCLGWRKPNERIFHEATRLLQVPPETCAYVGDTISRDVIGARRAGFGMAIQIRSFLTARSDLGVEAVTPDAVIEDLTQVVPLLTAEAEAVHDR